MEQTTENQRLSSQAVTLSNSGLDPEGADIGLKYARLFGIWSIKRQ